LDVPMLVTRSEPGGGVVGAVASGRDVAERCRFAQRIRRRAEETGRRPAGDAAGVVDAATERRPHRFRLAGAACLSLSLPAPSAAPTARPNNRRTSTLYPAALVRPTIAQGIILCRERAVENVLPMECLPVEECHSATAARAGQSSIRTQCRFFDEHRPWPPALRVGVTKPTRRIGARHPPHALSTL
jgi:hypothetical protein